MTKAERQAGYDHLAARLKVSRGVKLKIDVVPMFDALEDWRLGDGATAFVSEALATAVGDTDSPMTCFCCLEPWSPSRSPGWCLTVEFIGMPSDDDGDEALLAGVCRSCMEKEGEIMRAVQRDFKLDDIQIARSGNA
jgi:hypothetical protein